MFYRLNIIISLLTKIVRTLGNSRVRNQKKLMKPRSPAFARSVPTSRSEGSSAIMLLHSARRILSLPSMLYLVLIIMSFVLCNPGSMLLLMVFIVDS